jgi:outer membrane immunogenic protein
MLRKIAALSICLLGLASAALADGYAPRYGRTCCQFSWTGFYVGANVGVLWDDSSHTLSPSGSFLTDPDTVPINSVITRTGDLDATSLTGGVQVGYNHQMGMLVVGVESDFNGAGSRASDSVVTSLPGPLLTGTMTHGVDEKLEWFGTLRARVGIADARWLIYATGGWAFGHVNSSTFVKFSRDGDVYSSSFSETRSGWVAGGGFEYAFRDNWTVKGEVLWMDLGKVSYVSPERNGLYPGFSYTYTTHLDLNEVVARVGLNYKFGAREPVRPLK